MEDYDKYYEILDLDHGATEREIKDAYRELSMVWHPDRFQNNPKLQKKAEVKFKEINEAYQYFKSTNFIIPTQLTRIIHKRERAVVYIN